MEKSILIVGSGMSGLSAGCYARMNGYNTEIFELHKIPGGLCTAWNKKGYTFDISMHMLTGSVRGPFHEMWKELGIIDKFKFHFHDNFSQIEGKGKKLILTTDREKLQSDMIALSPEDTKLIREFIRVIFGPDLTDAVSLSPRGLRTIIAKLKSGASMIPALGFFMKYNKVSLQQFASQFKDAFLREAIRFFIDSPGWPMPDFPMLAMVGIIKGGVTEAGAPLGGSQKVAFHLANLFTEMGGIINYNSRVTGLIIEANCVKGIRLENGTERRADIVIWAGDGHTLHYDILKEKHLSERIKSMYENWTPVKPIVHVMMGVNRDLSAEPHRITFELDEPIVLAGRSNKWMTVINHCFDPSMAPAGKSEVEVWLDTEYDYWEKLVLNRKEYEAEKKRLADLVIRQLEKRWPGYTSQIEVVDVPTPVTYKRFTGNWKGSPDGWYLTTQNINAMEPVKNIPGLEGIYTAGQWTSPFTGTVIAALTGRQIIQLICKKDRKKFNHHVPVPQPPFSKPQPEKVSAAGV